MTSEELPSLSSSGGSTSSVSDGHLNPPSSPSTSFDSAPESDVSAASSLLSDGTSGPEPEPVVSRKPRPPVRSWPASDEIALLEAVVSHQQKHGQRKLPSPDGLAAALRGRLRTEDRLSPEQVAKRLRALRTRYHNAAIRLKRGIIPVKDGDVTIYKLSKLIWAGTRAEKREKKTPAGAADAREDPRGFDELAELYPCLSAEAEAIDARCGHGTLKRAFGHIGDDTAARLEAKLKRQRIAEAKESTKLHRLRKDVAKALQLFIK